MLVLEFTVEPFAEGAPGPHVQAALDAAAGPDVTVEFGPFGTVVTGPDEAVLAAADRVARAAVAAGASQVSTRLSRG
ncbi:MAG TPA: thiamine-binding protein [Iamia sp.]|nr:thiamine-binding protein [Iamia sp.]